MDKKTIHMVTFLLAMIGGLNWGLVGLFNIDLVTTLLGSMPTLVTLVYILIGLSAAFVLATHKNDCKICGKA